MPKQSKCGIYSIEHLKSGRLYIGSSKAIRQRWYQHRLRLKRGTHHSPYLQHAWAKYGSEEFSFVVIEECLPDELEAKEQIHLDRLNSVFNVVRIVKTRKLDPNAEARRIAALRARNAAITHCPHGHEYTKKNAYIDRNGTRICRTCNSLRVSAIYAKETPEQREVRRKRIAASHAANREVRMAKQREYAALHRSEKKEYDKQRAARKRIARKENSLGCSIH